MLANIVTQIIFQRIYWTHICLPKTYYESVFSVDLGVMVMKVYFTLIRYLEKEAHHQVHFSVIPRLPIFAWFRLLFKVYNHAYYKKCRRGEFIYCKANSYLLGWVLSDINWGFSNNQNIFYFQIFGHVLVKSIWIK